MLNKKQQVVVLSAAVMFFCLLLLYKNFNNIRGAFFIDPAALRRTQGEIISSTVRYKYGRKSSGYVYEILYDYEVGDNLYLSYQVNFASIIGDDKPAFAQAYVGKYPVGKKVIVFYKFDEPSFSVLEPDVKNGTIYMFIGLSSGLTLSLIGLLWSAIYPGKSRKSPK
jgi:hypothetical protein